MSVTSKNMRSTQHTHARSPLLPRRLHTVAYGITLLLATLAIYAAISLLISNIHTGVDDLRYGRPRTIQLDSFVGHDEPAGHPTHVIAMNLNRQVVVVELPGGDPSKTRTIVGPYLFGADADLTPVLPSLRDVDGDGQPDLLLDIRREQIVYLNKDGAFRLPTPDEQVKLNLGSGQ
jgi:hypothetical protein